MITEVGFRIPTQGRCVSGSQHSGFHLVSATLFRESDSESDE